MEDLEERLLPDMQTTQMRARHLPKLCQDFQEEGTVSLTFTVTLIFCWGLSCSLETAGVPQGWESSLGLAIPGSIHSGSGVV